MLIYILLVIGACLPAYIAYVVWTLLRENKDGSWKERQMEEFAHEISALHSMSSAKSAGSDLDRVFLDHTNRPAYVQPIRSIDHGIGAHDASDPLFMGQVTGDGFGWSDTRC